MRKPLYVEKPWGFFLQFTHNETSTVKIITIKPHHQLSLQSHKKRDELWVFLDEGLIVEVGDKKVVTITHHNIFIPKGAKHRLTNNLDHAGSVLEISFGDFDENDLIRYEDKYGRL